MVKARLASALLALSLAASLATLPACSSPDGAGTSATSAASSASQDATSPQGSPASGSSQANDAAADISVAVTIASPKTDDGFETIDASVAVPAGSSALDALQAATPDVIVEDGSYGAFVSSINGLANGTAGAQSGWTYTLNGNYVAESADACILNDGDVVAWEFYV